MSHGGLPTIASKPGAGSGVPSGERSQRPLLRTHLVERVVRYRLEREPDRQRVLQRDLERALLEQRERALRFVSRSPRRTAQRREPGTEQAVGDDEVVIEK